MAERAYDDGQILVEALIGIGDYGNNAYILSGPQRDAVTIIDAPGGAEAILEAVGTRRIERIVVTHSHFDHWAGFDVLRAATDAPVSAGAEETNLEVSRGILPLRHGERLAIGGVEAEVIHTPGHTPGSICIRFGGVVLTGDTLFPGGPGRTRDNASLLQEVESIATRLLVLPPEMLVLPGHGPSCPLATSVEEHAAFASKPHAADLAGDVLWLES